MRAESLEGTLPGEVPPGSDAERVFFLAPVQLPEVLHAAFDGKAPNYIAEFGYTLATELNRFYRDHHILNEAGPCRQASWLRLADVLARALETVLDLLGITVPERL